MVQIDGNGYQGTNNYLHLRYKEKPSFQEKTRFLLNDFLIGGYYRGSELLERSPNFGNQFVNMLLRHRERHISTARPMNAVVEEPEE